MIPPPTGIQIEPRNESCSEQSYGRVDEDDDTGHNDIDSDDNMFPSAAMQQQPTNETNGGEGSGLLSSIPPSAQWSVVLFSITTILLFADQNLMSPNLTQIANDFGFTEEQRDTKLGGDIALAFWVLGAPASYVIGCLADTYNRSLLFGITVCLGEGACLLTAFCQTYPQLYLARAVTGLALGGALPLIYSVLGDLFSAQQRHMVGAVVGAGTGCGIMVGQAVAGFVGPTFGWRLPFVLISLPALCCAALVWSTVQDPPRGQMEAAVIAIREQRQQQQNIRGESVVSLSPPSSPRGERSNSSHGDIESFADDSHGLEMAPIMLAEQQHLETITTTSQYKDHDGHVYTRHSGDEHDEDQCNSCGHGATAQTRTSLEGTHDYWGTFRQLMATPTVLLCLLQGAPGCVPWGIINTYLNDFLAQEKGMTVEAATTVALVFGLGNFFGLLFGGAGGSYLYSKGKRFPALLAGGTSIGACFPFWYLVNLSQQHSYVATIYFGSMLLGFLSGATGPIVKASLTNVTMPQARGQAFSLFNTFDDFGRGLGPVFVSALIRNMGGRVPAFNLGVFGWMLCGLANLFMFFTVEKDENHVQVLVSLQMTRRSGSSV